MIDIEIYSLGLQNLGFGYGDFDLIDDGETVTFKWLSTKKQPAEKEIKEAAKN